MIELPYLTKPLYGSPCNGCGLCCQQEICPIGEKILGSVQAPCPLLLYSNGRTWCGAIVNDHPLTPLLKLALGIDKGCCSLDEPYTEV